VSFDQVVRLRSRAIRERHRDLVWDWSLIDVNESGTAGLVSDNSTGGRLDSSVNGSASCHSPERRPVNRRNYRRFDTLENVALVRAVFQSHPSLSSSEMYAPIPPVPLSFQHDRIRNDRVRGHLVQLREDRLQELTRQIEAAALHRYDSPIECNDLYSEEERQKIADLQKHTANERKESKRKLDELRLAEFRKRVRSNRDSENPQRDMEMLTLIRQRYHISIY